MKSVCIVGGGPAGLASAKVFLQRQQFKVTVFEKKDRIGGIWALDRKSKNAFLIPNTPVNLSRFTVAFSDLDWNSVDYADEKAKGVQNGTAANVAAPMFPEAWMANKYLEAYRRKYIPDGIIKCGHEVTKAERWQEKWNISVKNGTGHEEFLQFDYLVMASGFFARPRSLKQNVPILPAPSAKSSLKMLHTSSFRSVDDLFPEGTSTKGKIILIIGGGNSAGETAGTVASQLSDALWSPETSKAQKFKDVKIVQVAPRPLYPIPPFVEYENESRSYVPLDFKLYDFSKRPKDLPAYGGQQSMEVRNIVHGALQAMVGGDLSDIHKALVSHKGEGRGSVYVALSETYAEYVRSSMIDVVPGRVTEIETGDDGSTHAIIKQGNDDLVIDDIAAVIYATGYTPSPALDILDNATKATIQYDPKSLRLPIILDQWQTMNKNAPTVSFIGFYEGPYWPVIEMQARLTAERWLSGQVAESNPYESEEQLFHLRQSMHDRGQDVPQYWHGDHLGYMEDLAKQLELKRNDSNFGPWEGIPSPARYLSPHTDTEQANAIMQEIHQIWTQCIEHGKFVPRAAFRALQGNWTIKRRIDSATSTFPSGTLEGTASFHPRTPTPDKSNKHFNFEYLYIESGTFTLSNGSTMPAKRRYVYRYSEPEDTLSVWFVKPDRELEVDYVFHNLAFVPPREAREAGALVAKADHPCGKDMYWTEYRMPMKGVALTEFEIKHTVRGPKKEYVAVTEYTRPRR